MHFRFLFLFLFLGLDLEIYAYDNAFLFDLDPIGNNQILLNSYNPNVLDTFIYKSLIYHQSHHIPYGTFIFDDALELATLDSVGTMTQFIHKKGDYRFRDLIASLHRVNNQGSIFRYAIHTRSYTPLNLYGLNGSNFLQNYLFDVTKEEDNSYSSATILYHVEAPELPLSYYTYNSDNYYNTRSSKSFLWGLNHRLNGSRYSIEFKTSSQFSLLKNNAINSESGIEYEENSFKNNSFNRLSSLKGKYYMNKFASLFLDFTEIYTQSSRILFNNNNEQQYQDYLLSVGFELKNKNILSFEIYQNFNSDLVFTPKIMLSLFENTKNHLYYELDNFSYRSPVTFENLFWMNNRIGFDHTATYSLIGFNLGIINDDYMYIKIGTSYDNGKRKIGVNFTTFFCNLETSGYLDEFSNFNNFNLPFARNQLNYFLKYDFPIKNKPYSFLFELEGRYFEISNGGVNLNSLPMITSTSHSSRMIKNFIDLTIGIKYDNFELTYHSITNNGKDFSLEYPFSDIGSAFEIPEYSFMGEELFLFHYLKISWSFID